jgi:hypothetical protein
MTIHINAVRWLARCRSQSYAYAIRQGLDPETHRKRAGLVFGNGPLPLTILSRDGRDQPGGNRDQ